MKYMCILRLGTANLLPLVYELHIDFLPPLAVTHPFLCAVGQIKPWVAQVPLALEIP